MLNANRIRAMNPKIEIMTLMHPQALNPEDGDLFPIKPSLEVRPASDDDFDTAVDEDGNLRIRRKSGRPLLTQDADLVRIETTQSLCNACLSALGALAKYLEQKFSARDDDEMIDGLPPNVILHWNTLGLMDSHLYNCDLCSLIVAHLRPRGWIGRKIRVELVVDNVERRTNSSASELAKVEDILIACAIAFENAPERTNRTYSNMFKLRFWSSPENDRWFPVTASTGDGPPSGLLEVAPRGSNTRYAKDVAIDWLQRCKDNHGRIHGACETGKSPWYPTRLLDTSNASPGGIVRVVYPEKHPELFDVCPSYITLSHCWGDSRAAGLPYLLEENKDLYELEGIPFDELPPLIRDAMEITHWFKVRWLWIDSLCIIQNSPGMSDWSIEAAHMFKIYKYGLLNISADASENAQGGCFRDRLVPLVTPFKLQMVNLQKSWWVATDERDLFEWVTHAPLPKRAWAFQERQLARRVLHFTAHEVFWECCATEPYCACEMYPHGTPFETRFLKVKKYEPSTLLSEPSLKNKHRMWFDLCEDFSARALAFEKDRLPALAGLAAEFAPLFPADDYIAGFWSSTLPESLLWSKERTNRQMGVCDAYVAPTWSWLSSKSTVHFGVLPKTNYRFRCAIAEIVATSVTPLTQSPFGSIKENAYIELQGFMRHLRIVRTPVFKEVNEYDRWCLPYRSHEQSLFVDGSEMGYEDRASKFSFSYQMDDEVEKENEADNSNDSGSSQPSEWSGHCFLVAVSRQTAESELNLEGLVLEQTDTQGVFKRVGKVRFSGLSTLPVAFKLGNSISHQMMTKLSKSMPAFSSDEKQPSVGPMDKSKESQIEGDSSRPHVGEDKEESGGNNRTGPMALYDIFSTPESWLVPKLTSCTTVRII